MTLLSLIPKPYFGFPKTSCLKVSDKYIWLYFAVARLSPLPAVFLFMSILDESKLISCKGNENLKIVSMVKLASVKQ